jgi:DNA-binding HxlR family transcriptional regulator
MPFMAPAHSALSDALVRIGDRWSLLLVEALSDGPLRFADLQSAVAGISTNILTTRLRHLEAEGLILAVPYSERPLRFSYELTDAGRGLGGAVRILAQWSAEHGGRSGPTAATGGDRSDQPEGTGTPTHELCGTPMEVVWWCPTCEQPGGPDGSDAVWV